MPLLGDIPVLGMLFRSDRWEDSRTELLVMLTPYVLVTPEQARQETRRLYESGSASRAGWQRGWTDSDLADPPRPAEDRPSTAPRVSVLRRPTDAEARGSDGGAIEIITIPDEPAAAP